MNKKLLAGILILIVFSIGCQSDTHTDVNAPAKKAGEIRIQRTAEQQSPVKSIRTIEENGGRVDWSPKGDLIAFDRKGEDGYYDIWIMNTDGSQQKCLTCNNPDLPMHNGNPTWYASGEYIAFQGVDPCLRCRILERWTRHPGGGINNNLWIVNKEGTRFWQVTKVKDRMGVLHPHFSYDGKKILWAEKVNNEPKAWGDWVMKIADFSIQNNEPVISNIITVKPDNLQFFETHGFSPDNSKITFSAFYPAKSRRTYNGECTSLDEYIYDLNTEKLSRLTNDTSEWDEFLQFSPDGKKLIWMSSRDIPQERDKNGDIIGGKLKADYWIMDADGSNKRQLTHFNTPGYPEYTPSGKAPADYSWSPDGKKIVAKVRELPGRFDAKEHIMLIEFDTVPRVKTNPVTEKEK